MTGRKQNKMDPYKVLGIDRDASEEEIKAAYRRKARIYHPDENPKDEDAALKMNEINEAYEMIKNRKGSDETLWQEDGYSYENEKTPEAYSPVRQNFLFHPVFRRVVILILIASMAVMSVLAAFFQALGR